MRRGSIDDYFFVSPRNHEGHEAVKTRSGGGGIIRVAAASVCFYTVAAGVALCVGSISGLGQYKAELFKGAFPSGSLGTRKKECIH